MQHRRLIDVRQPAEFARGHIEGAELVPLRSISQACEDWDRKQPITLICLSGHRAEVARRQLHSRGFTDLQVLPGGIQRWRKAGKPLNTMPQAGGTHPALRWIVGAAVILASIVLARFLSPWFLALPAVLVLSWFSK